VRLPKARFAKLRPLHNLFSSVAAVKDCLELNLRFHAALTENDLVTVWYRGAAHVLRVTEVRATAADEDERGDDSGAPRAGACSLIDTDVEIDLDVSEEYQADLASKQTPEIAPASTNPIATAAVQPLQQSQGRTLSSTTVFAPTAAAAAEALSQTVDRDALRQKRLAAMEKARGGGV